MGKKKANTTSKQSNIKAELVGKVDKVLGKILPRAKSKADAGETKSGFVMVKTLGQGLKPAELVKNKKVLTGGVMAMLVGAIAFLGLQRSPAPVDAALPPVEPVAAVPVPPVPAPPTGAAPAEAPASAPAALAPQKNQLAAPVKEMEPNKVTKKLDKKSQKAVQKAKAKASKKAMAAQGKGKATKADKKAKKALAAKTVE